MMVQALSTQNYNRIFLWYVNGLGLANVRFQKKSRASSCALDGLFESLGPKRAKQEIGCEFLIRFIEAANLLDGAALLNDSAERETKYLSADSIHGTGHGNLMRSA